MLRGFMTPNRKDDDQEMSMEEILASIRKYVTEDDSHGGQAASPSYHPDAYATAGEEVLDLKHIKITADNLQSQSNVASFVSLKQSEKFVEEKPVQKCSVNMPPYTGPERQTSTSEAHPLTSPQTVHASAQALSRLVESTKAMQEFSAPSTSPLSQTLESLAMQAITPHVKQWLDANLSKLVETLVQREIERLSKGLLKS